MTYIREEDFVPYQLSHALALVAQGQVRVQGKLKIAFSREASLVSHLLEGIGAGRC